MAGILEGDAGQRIYCKARAAALHAIGHLVGVLRRLDLPLVVLGTEILHIPSSNSGWALTARAPCMPVLPRLRP